MRPAQRASGLAGRREGLVSKKFNVCGLGSSVREEAEIHAWRKEGVRRGVEDIVAQRYFGDGVG